MTAPYRNRFSVSEKVYPVHQHALRFKIIELLDTCDGVRSRITHDAFDTLEQAIAACDALNKKEEIKP